MRVRELNPALEARQFTRENTLEIKKWLESDSFSRWINRVEVLLTNRRDDEELRPEIKVYLSNREGELMIYEDDWIVIGNHSGGSRIRCMDEEKLHEFFEKDSDPLVTEVRS